MNTPVALSSLLFETRQVTKLRDIPEDPISIIYTLKWLDYLSERVSTSNVSNAVKIYYNLGWISDEVVLQLLTYLKGIKKDNYDLKDNSCKLTITDHLVSLLFIERINGKKTSGETLDTIEWEIRKIKEGVEQSYGI
ncbi:FlaD/FlaE family flagellar protein [Methanococcus aeolicus]|jgi:flagellar protein FlaE|uniref:Flagella protein n=1 Tax=Methanococcus aeolicus (strain ATCC BAA-1280 / DSM 17508 / OCM 812 / Nankai-3) TaxID=419665 RepID=A6UTN0_META3|nr:FlaD/FlaE family flagellar protein [Methanococcus aeolicus]ABR55852.1 flagella protein [Methanococcus aeolicus Nankai-3]UXM84042.1 flagellar protein E [Methanococcus aeolicus]